MQREQDVGQDEETAAGTLWGRLTFEMELEVSEVDAVETKTGQYSTLTHNG